MSLEVFVLTMIYCIHSLIALVCCYIMRRRDGGGEREYFLKHNPNLCWKCRLVCLHFISLKFKIGAAPVPAQRIGAIQICHTSNGSANPGLRCRIHISEYIHLLLMLHYYTRCSYKRIVHLFSVLLNILISVLCFGAK